MLSPGSSLQERYDIVRVIGGGGMGVVYEAIHRNLQKRFAIKQTTIGDEDEFQREGQLLAQLKHPALLTVSDYFSIEHEGHFLVMEYVPGPDLAEVLNERNDPFEIDKVLTWANELLDVVEYLHGNQVIHRDIKPSNLKLNEQGKVVLLDFGLAKLEASTSSGLLPSRPYYTPGYAAPEQETGKRTDMRTDVYGIAATLYTLLTKEVPPTATERMLSLNETHVDALRPVNDFNRSVDPTVSYILQKALALKPEGRFANVQEFRAAVSQATAHQTKKTSDAKPETGRRRYGIIPVRYWWLGLAIMVLAAGGITGWLAWSLTTQHSSISSVRLPQQLGTPSTENPSVPVTSTLDSIEQNQNRDFISSTFEHNSDGWSTEGAAHGHYMNGYLCADDAAGGENEWFWKAPSKFLGDQSRFYGGGLSFSRLLKDGINSEIDRSNDVVLVGADTTLTLDTTNPGNDWTPEIAQLQESGGWIKQNGLPPTQSEMQTVLKSLTKLLIRGEYRNGGDSSCLRSVSMYRSPYAQE